MLTIEDIRDRLSEIRILGARQNIVAGGFVRRIELDQGLVTIVLALPPMKDQARRVLDADIRRAVHSLPGVSDVRIEAQEAPPGPSPPAEPGPLSGVRNIVAVSSVKGGVGKSTVAVHLALSMRQFGLGVGILDLDVYGPSLPVFLGHSGTPSLVAEHRLSPVERCGLQLMSVGFFLEEDAPVIWRGPVVMSLARQFLRDVAWNAVDVLLVDLPPGTGDAVLSLLQLVPVAGAVIVTTPQQVALRDVERGVAMLRTVAVPVLGIVENMSYYRCPKCGQKESLFSSGGGNRLSEMYGIPLLGQVPLTASLRGSATSAGGDFPLREDPETAAVFQSIAGQLMDALANRSGERPAPRIIN